ncbi:hypothetical protein BDQ12DRAFT_677842 [Crucibulum laeve]|uniref:Uncharacterized protein n=1 Tax=Crucibulum laeve TaxID=68775 RepID=A0A5C3M9Y5_9AGAR|nr:hypothetical protein BDQ12DRAFT_677842 [Crucibulum laeve]
MADQNAAATEHLIELLLTLKQTTPADAKRILNSQPPIAYALITMMVAMNAINIEVFQKTLSEFGTQAAAQVPSGIPQPQSLPPPSMPIQASAIPPHLQAQYRTTTPPSHPPSAPPQSAYGYPNGHGPPQSYSHTPPHPGYGPQHQNPQQHQHQQQQNPQHGYGYPQQPPAYPNYPQPQYGGTPQPGPPQQPQTILPEALAAIPPDQKALIMRVVSMSQEQLNALPPTERATFMQIRATLGMTG